ncbi:PREDICTED: protein C-ets-2-like isoform X2 [Elephantulus edwardii]|uniref:protein C-ets-2-like isoform X2 n=1 Tax=Elephantulus edwardii TaxID=28737 RepID=UPI0003F05D6B|nr:PREDICTED: protein C-ets-2-like isoform X2 [Elephantulus edwardii]
MDQVAPVSSGYRGVLKRQPAFDTFDGSLFAGFPSLNEEQTLQEVPTGLDSISHESSNCELPLLTPCSKAVMSQALKATFSGFKKEQRRLGIPKNPWLWTEQQVCQWLLWATNEFSLVNVNLQRFGMTGQVLCNLGKERFLELAPDFVGDILWEHLEQMIKENQEKTEDQYEENSHLNSVPHWINNNSIGLSVEQASYGMQTQNYPKGGLLEGLCQPSPVPGALSSEQEFQLYPKSRLSTIGINYCPVSQDFQGSNLNLLTNNSGKPYPRTTTPPTVVGTALRVQTRCCSPGTASHPCLTYSGYLPSRALRMTAASPLVSTSQPCPSRTTSRRGVTQWSRANQLYLRLCWLASQEVDLFNCGSFSWSYFQTSLANRSLVGQGMDGSLSSPTLMRWPAGGGRGKTSQR